MRPVALLVFVLFLTGGCAPAKAPIERPASGDTIPEAFYRQAAAAGQRVLRVDPARSLVVIEVGREGSLAGLGHDHVIASRDVQGFVAPELGRADLQIPLDRLTVDEPALRAESGLGAMPSTDAIEGTRRNMLDKVLETQRFPSVLVSLERSGPDVRMVLNLHGTSKSWLVPVRIDATTEGLVASGRLELRQTDFGMTPYTVLGGALQVRDRLNLRFRISAS